MAGDGDNDTSKWPTTLITSEHTHASITLQNHIWKRWDSRADAQHDVRPIGIVSALSLPYLVTDPMGFLLLTSVSCRLNARHGRHPTVPPPAIYASGCYSPIYRRFGGIFQLTHGRTPSQSFCGVTCTPRSPGSPRSRRLSCHRRDVGTGTQKYL